MKFIIDNYGSGNKIESTVRFHIEDKIDLGNLYTYPQRKKVILLILINRLNRIILLHLLRFIGIKELSRMIILLIIN